MGLLFCGMLLGGIVCGIVACLAVRFRSGAENSLVFASAGSFFNHNDGWIADADGAAAGGGTVSAGVESAPVVFSFTKRSLNKCDC